MPSLIAHLSAAMRTEFLKNLNYLNIKEYQGFCKKHGIPYSIYVETPTGLKKTNDKDRKKIVLKKIRHYLNTGKILNPTVFPKSVCKSTKLKNPNPSTRLFFGQYDKKNGQFLKVMQSLTDGGFRNGMIARVVIRDFWTQGIAPTLKEYAKAWIAADKANTKYHPEAAYLSDLSDGNATPEWKKMRTARAKAAMNILSKIGPEKHQR